MTVGVLEAKSTPVYFHAYKWPDQAQNATNITITYERAFQNVGNAMNISTGLFTAPHSGIYFFSALGRNQRNASLELDLYSSRAGLITRAATVLNLDTITLTAILQVNRGEQLYLRGKGEFHNNENTIYFNGMLLQEELF